MNGADIAAWLLLASLALALAFVPRRTALAGTIAAGAIAISLALGVSAPDREIAFAGCWATIMVASLSVFWPRLAAEHFWLSLLFAANAGAWAGLLLASETGSTATFGAVSALLMVIPGQYCVSRGWTIVPRVATSWLLAVALLAGAIPHLVSHPGYVPDHRE